MLIPGAVFFYLVILPSVYKGPNGQNCKFPRQLLKDIFVKIKNQPGAYCKINLRMIKSIKDRQEGVFFRQYGGKEICFET